MNPLNKWLLGSVSAAVIAGATLWEGTKTTAYYDIVNVLTVCNGYTGKDIVKGKVYTKAECKFLLEKELKIHANGILKCITVPLSQHQFDAFTLFAYNVGVGAFCSSKTVLQPLNKGNYQQACDGLLRWTYADGKYVKGLYNRRVYERAMCRGELNVPEIRAVFDYSPEYYRWWVSDPPNGSKFSSSPSESKSSS